MRQTDAATRSRTMARVKSKDTTPELLVRSVAHRLGYRFRLHCKGLPGNPDIVFPSRRIALFVHGCFWHGHSCPHGSRMPVQNGDYWRNKIEGNMARDSRVQKELEGMGWRPVILWECQISATDLPELLKAILSGG